MPDPSCPAGSEQKDASQKLVWVDNDTIAAALGDWWTVLSYLKYIPPFLPVWLPSFCATVPTGPFEITDEDWASLASGDGFTVVDVLNVVRNRVNWYVWNEYCQCVATEEGTPVQCYGDAVLADSPYLYWPLDDASGTQITDASGNGRHGTAVGTYTLNQAGPFTGSTSVRFPTASAGRVEAAAGVVVPGTSWTIEVWEVSDADSPSEVNFAGSIGVMRRMTHTLFSGTGTRYAAEITRSSDNTGVYARDNTDWTTRRGGWAYYVGRFDASTNTLSFWVNGAQTQAVGAGSSSVVPTVPFAIGTVYNTGGVLDTHGMKGNLSNVAAYDYALSDARIAAHYAARLGGCPGTPTAIDPPDTPTLPTGFDAPPTLECDEAQLCVDINRIRIDLANAATMVNTIQRQAAPFAYQLVDTFTISGSGTLSVRAILALSVDFTAIPTYKSHKGSAVVDYLDLGYLNLGTADGWVTREILRHDGHLVADIPGYVDRVGYDLAPGVEATLRTYRRLA